MPRFHRGKISNIWVPTYEGLIDPTLHDKVCDIRRFGIHDLHGFALTFAAILLQCGFLFKLHFDHAPSHERKLVSNAFLAGIGTNFWNSITHIRWTTAPITFLYNVNIYP